MQWSDEKNAGFGDGTPWLALNPNYKEINVKEQENRADSVLSYYKKLVALRKSDAYKETFTYGDFVPAYREKEDIFAFHRKSKESGQDVLVLANFGSGEHTLKLDGNVKQVLLSNLGREQAVCAQAKESGSVTLASCECVVAVME